MKFETTVLRDFRNLGSAGFEWGPGINFLCGPNGAGKTNLLESLNVLSGWGPFSGRIGGLTAWDSRTGRALLAARVSGESSHDFKVRISTRMTLAADEKHITCTELRLLLPSLTFLPADINLVDGSPSVRRLFLDKLCALCLAPYARRRAEFHQISRHRAALLRQGRPVRGTTLPFARLGGWIMEARRSVAAHLLSLSHLACPSTIPFTFSLRPALSGSGEDCLLAALEEHAERERHALRPLVGPGRDDLEILSLDRPASASLSRGQKRRLVLSLILMAARLVETRLRRSPVLIFDDLTAELDADGRAAAGRALADTGWQVFISGTEDPFPEVKKTLLNMPEIKA